jgi:hypothetical protein
MIVDGTKRPDSMVLMVLREIPMGAASASKIGEAPSHARGTMSRFGTLRFVSP